MGYIKFDVRANIQRNQKISCFFYSCNVSEPQSPKFCVLEVGVNLNVFLLTISTPYSLHCNTTLHQHRDCDQVPVPGRQTWPLSALLAQAQVKLRVNSFVSYLNSL